MRSFEFDGVQKIEVKVQKAGLVRDLNPGPPAP